MQGEVRVRIYMKIQKPTNELRQIPGVGVSIAKDFEDQGIRKISDLAGKNPHDLYEELCKLRGVNIYRCMLYVMRCVVYFASNTRHSPEKLKWWNWKNVTSEYES